MWRLSSQDLTCRIRSFFICEKFPSLLYLLVFSPDTLRSWPQVCLSLQSTCKVSQKCRHKGKGNCHKSQIFVCGELGNFLKEIITLKNAKNFCHKNLMAQGWADTRGEGVLLCIGHMGMYFCSPKEYGFSIEPLLQNNHNIFSFL